MTWSLCHLLQGRNGLSQVHVFCNDFVLYTDLTLVILGTIPYISLSSFECVFIMSSISFNFDLYFKEIHSKEYI